MIQIPVLVIGFNRPDLLKDLFDHLFKLKILKVFVALDGPRKLEESMLCAQSLEVARKFKKHFEIKILYRKENLGCALGVVSALDWFFEEVDFGIVLEDDCVPNEAFFDFALNFYQEYLNFNAQRIKLVTAHNPFDTEIESNVTNSTLIHGWATYSSVWKNIRKDYFKFNLPIQRNIAGDKRGLAETLYWWANATRAKLGVVDTWDGIFTEKVWTLGFKTLIPSSNLIENVGYGPNATHTKNLNDSNLVHIANNKLLGKNLNFLLNKYYFCIRKRHIVTSILRVLIDYFKMRNKIKYEQILIQDLSRRFIEYP
jgi:hypothetical protein